MRRGALFLSLQSIIRRAAGLGTIARMFLRVSDFTTLLTLSFSIIDLQSFGLQYCVGNKRLTKISIRNLKGINQRMSMFLLLLSPGDTNFTGLVPSQMPTQIGWHTARSNSTWRRGLVTHLSTQAYASIQLSIELRHMSSIWTRVTS